MQKRATQGTLRPGAPNILAPPPPPPSISARNDLEKVGTVGGSQSPQSLEANEDRAPNVEAISFFFFFQKNAYLSILWSKYLPKTQF